MYLLIRRTTTTNHSHLFRPNLQLLTTSIDGGDGPIAGDPRRRREIRDGGGGQRRRPMRLHDGVALPLPRDSHARPLHRLNRPLLQAPPLLLWSFPPPLPSLLQEKLPSLTHRPFSTEAPQPFYQTEAERVCKVIEDLFGSDRNMEAVLDRSNVDLSSPLVVEVLRRFRHAWRPAFRFFRWAGLNRPGYAHDGEAYNSMMNVLGKARQFETMVEMLNEMGRERVLEIRTFKIAIKVFAAAREVKKAIGMFELMKRYDFDAGIETFNYLLDCIAQEKLAKEAQEVFVRMREQFPPDLRTYTVLLSGWCKVKNLVEAGWVWNEMVERGFKPDIVAHNVMLEGLVSCRRREEAMKLWEIMKAKGPKPDVRSYTVLIKDLCKQGFMGDAEALLDEMVGFGCSPDTAVYTCLIIGYGNLKRMDRVAEMLREMKERGCPPDGRLFNALIKLMTDRNMPKDAVRMYKKMVDDGFEPTIHTYNMIMKSQFLGAKDCEMGRAVWEEMLRKGCCPDVNSYTVFIGGLIRHGQSEEAQKYMEEMILKGMRAPQVDYNKFAADFSRVGKPDILDELAQKMKFAGKFEDSNLFRRWSERMMRRVKRGS
ncbi:Pentatricopeptide repeat-containing protein [Acorus gramineus]|uniref:Pentatricopeptide repeat-containing protein n=1 Tax=Acorus gramineus TaxID=55184 RepID=A0AAV9BMJ4_ACOGR|nr:Pentatricopeptide repeat-containing protein [Acorus gramineus]